MHDERQHFHCQTLKKKLVTREDQLLQIKKKYHPADEGRELFLVLLKKKISLAV